MEAERVSEWKTMDDPIPDPGSIWDGTKWVLYTVEMHDSAHMQVTTLMGFYNMVKHPDPDMDPEPVNWMLVNAPD